MLRLTLAQMRRSLGRLVAAGVAIGIGTAFVTATLLAGAAMTRTTYDSVTAAYAEADLVLALIDGDLTDDELEAVRAVPQVVAAHGYDQAGIDLAGPDGQAYESVRAAAPDASLEPAVPVDGTMAQTTGQIVLAAATADLLGLEVGDTVRATQTSWQTNDGVESTEVLVEELDVVGVLGTKDAAFMGTGGVSVVSGSQLEEWVEFASGGQYERSYWYGTLAVDDAAALEEVEAAVAAAVGPGVEVRTIDEEAKALTAELTGSADQLVAVILGFAAIALLVAALVISNTFQVLVAQRTRTLALLRCVGADRSQLRRSVVIEALIVGVAASAAGLILGAALVQTTLLVLDGTVTDVPLPTTIALTPAVVLIPLLLGTAVTVLAALAPARAATRVSPLAALRPSGTPRLSEPSGRARGVVASVLVLGGSALLVLGTLVAGRSDMMIGLGLGVLGGAASFLGIVLGAVFWVPRLVSATGSLLGSGATARLAAANSVRNPRRTAATSSALFIGVTLVALMSTGAASTRAALDETLGEEFPVDVAVGTVFDGIATPPLPAALPDEIRAIEGVSGVVEVTGTMLELVRPANEGGPLTYLEARGVERAAASQVVHAPGQLDGLTDATVLIPTGMAGWTGIVAGDQLTFRRQLVEATTVGQASEPSAAASDTLTVTAVITELTSSAMILTPGSVQALDPGAPVSRVWVGLSDLDGAEATLADITRAASDTGEVLETVGAAVERAFYQRVIDTLLAIVVGLLGVAVIIALVGVANTLSLSVLERRRESATLRALGLTRRQLRGTLAIEGMLIAGVGSVVGAGLGTVYGWVGARTLLVTVADVGLVVPWRDLALVVVVGLLAGLLASVLPGRSAARTSPVEALAVE